MYTLGIETSCDETSAAVIKDGNEILANVILSQKEHTKFGGVVPEVASRVHLKTIVPIYLEALEQAGLTLDQIGLIAATRGPGLIGPLLVGLTFAKGLALAANKPFIGVNHIEGHLSVISFASSCCPAAKIDPAANSANAMTRKILFFISVSFYLLTLSK